MYGLFEQQKLRWLEDEQWKSCGYIVDKNNDNTRYTLTREPLKRFEDLEIDGLSSMEIVSSGTSTEVEQSDVIINTIEKIIDENPTVEPADIGLIYIGNNSKGFLIADIVERKLKQKFDWNLNRAIKSKQAKVSNSVFFSNKNNVKGLEFPFIICISEHISNLLHERNALYMMLTRSFIQTYFVLPEDYIKNNFNDIRAGLDLINSTGKMIINAPSEVEQKQINAKIEFNSEKQSLHELLTVVFDDLNIPPLWHEAMLAIVKTKVDEVGEVDYEKIHSLVKSTQGLMAIS